MKKSNDCKYTDRLRCFQEEPPPKVCIACLFLGTARNLYEIYLLAHDDFENLTKFEEATKLVADARHAETAFNKWLEEQYGKEFAEEWRIGEIRDE